MLNSVLAYIDPGVGSLLLQMLIGSLVGVVLFFRQGIGRMLGMLRRSNTEAPTANPRSEETLGG